MPLVIGRHLHTAMIHALRGAVVLRAAVADLLQALNAYIGDGERDARELAPHVYALAEVAENEAALRSPIRLGRAAIASARFA